MTPEELRKEAEKYLSEMGLTSHRNPERDFYVEDFTNFLTRIYQTGVREGMMKAA